IRTAWPGELLPGQAVRSQARAHAGRGAVTPDDAAAHAAGSNAPSSVGGSNRTSPGNRPGGFFLRATFSAVEWEIETRKILENQPKEAPPAAACRSGGGSRPILPPSLLLSCGAFSGQGEPGPRAAARAVPWREQP